MNHKILMKITIFRGLLVVFLSHLHDLAALKTILLMLAVVSLWVLRYEELSKFYSKRIIIDQNFERKHLYMKQLSEVTSRIYSVYRSVAFHSNLVC